jgi:hypothetical protein
MRTALLCSVVAFCLVLCSVSCKPGQQSTPLISNVTNLVADARALAEQGIENGEWTWPGSSARLPSSIKLLAPQRVTLRTNPPPQLIDIRLRGGFWHHGIIVLCETNATYNSPTYGNGWRIRDLGRGVYEYKE